MLVLVLFAFLIVSLINRTRSAAQQGQQTGKAHLLNF